MAETVSSEDPPFDYRVRRCTEDVPVGRTVHLVADPPDDYDVLWRGEDVEDCAHSLECTIVIDASPAVTAVSRPMPRLSVTINGPVGSRIVSKPAGIDCELKEVEVRTETCTATVALGTKVTLTPMPRPAADFRHVGRRMLGQRRLRRVHDRVPKLWRDSTLSVFTPHGWLLRERQPIDVDESRVARVSVVVVAGG